MFSVDQEWNDSSKQNVLTEKLFGSQKKKKNSQKNKKKISGGTKFTSNTSNNVKSKLIKQNGEKPTDNSSKVSRKRKLNRDDDQSPNKAESYGNTLQQQIVSDNNMKQKKKKKSLKTTEKQEKLENMSMSDIVQKLKNGEEQNESRNIKQEYQNSDETKPNSNSILKNKISERKEECDKRRKLNNNVSLNNSDTMETNRVELKRESHSNRKKSKISEDTSNVKTKTDISDDSTDVESTKIEDHGLNKVHNPVPKKLSKFQEKLNRKLEGGHFRWINETLYTSESKDAQKLFKEQPNLFDVYHKGFESQVKNWPQNPVDLVISFLKNKSPSLIVADFGCGNAKLSQSIPNKVHSFDLVAVNEHVTACDMRRVPLSHSTVDVAVFSLALMGTNVTEFILEANRVLKNDGILKIAEVKSRFNDVTDFILKISTLGFQLTEKEESNKMFVILDFKKCQHVKRPRKIVKIELKPCFYKKR